MTRLFLLSLIYVILSLSTSAQPIPKMRTEDRIRIHEAEFLFKKFGNQVWPGINRVPFTLLVIDDTMEFLINCAKPGPEFRNVGYDSILSTQVYVRRAKNPDNSMAVLPVVNGQNAIVAGLPEKTGMTSTAWIITLLREHFYHYIYQDGQYYDDLNRLKLGKGDSIGLWIMNYPFPYESASVIKEYGRFSKALHDALKNLDSDNFDLFLQTYAKARTAFKKGLRADEYKYFSYQVWQEGVAHYVEYKFLESMEKYKPSYLVQQLADYTPYEVYKQQLFKDELDNLLSYKLTEQKRNCFFLIGFAEASLLDYLNPNWKKLYLKNKFYLEKY